jgi:hypothetical protein
VAKTLRLLLLVSLLTLAVSGTAQADPPAIHGDSVQARGAPIASGNGGGGGGNFIWFDIAGLNQTSLDWPSKATLDAKRTEVGTTNDVPKAEAQLSQDPRFANVQWSNVCQDSGGAVKTSSYPRKYGGGSAVDCVENASSFNSLSYPGEFQSANYKDAGLPAKLDQIVGWNIQIWREGDSTPIFQRRVGLCHDSSGDDDHQANLQVAWWMGGCSSQLDRTADLGSGTGGVFSNNRASAGPLGEFSSDKADYQQCEHWRTSSPVGWQNIDDPYGRPVDYSNTLRNSRLAPTACYWDLGKGEALRINWTVNSLTGMGHITYILLGRPGFFYAVHITAIDHVEQVLLPFVPKPAFQRGQNYFRVFVAKHVESPPQPPCKKNCCKVNCPPPTTTTTTTTTPTTTPPQPPCPDTDPTCQPSTATEPANPIVTLNADTPLPTRVAGKEIVDITAPELDIGQALFPELVQVIHYTPQWRYNGGVNSQSDYASDYVTYKSLYTRLPSKPNSVSPQRADMAILQQPSQLSSINDPTNLSHNLFDISWLRPTLTNPCQLSLQTSDPIALHYGGGWPSDVTKCQSAGAYPLDAWDDYLEAQTIYETRWLAGDSKQTVGFIKDQPLRCGPGGARSISNGCGDSHLQSYTGSDTASDGSPAGATQHAQGYLYAKPQAAHVVKGLDAVVNLNFSQSGYGGTPTPTVWNRDTQQQTRDDGTPYIERWVGANTITGRPDLWFCTNGIPGSAKVDLGVNGDLTRAGGDKTAAAIDADPTSNWYQQVTNNAAEGCGGYTAKWRFDQNGETWSSNWYAPWGTCNYNQLPNRASQYPFPNDGDPSFNPADQWGRYAADGTWQINSNVDLRPLLNGTVPYEGARPGRPGADSGDISSAGCSKSFSGLHYYGQWDNVGSHPVTTDPGYTITFPCYSYRDPETKIKYTFCPDPVIVPPTVIQVPEYAWHWRGSGDLVQGCYPSGPSGATQSGAPITTQHYVSPSGDGSGTEYETSSKPPNDGISGQIVGNWQDGWGCNSPDIGAGNSYVTKGSWKLASNPGNGWGLNQNGSNLPEAGYVFDYAFSNLSSTSAGNVSWNMNANYEGFSGWNWMTETKYSDIQNNPEAGSNVLVYATRPTR